jgi:hypothetical protein
LGEGSGRAFLQTSQMHRADSYALESGNVQVEMGKHAANFAVLAFD